MAKKKKPAAETAPPEEPAPVAPPGDSSLSALSRAFAKVIGRKKQIEAEAAGTAEPAYPSDVDAPTDAASPETIALAAASEADDDSPPPSPAMIVEGAIFVGRPGNEPLSSRQIAALVRGVSPQEVDAIVRQLNESYEAEGAAWQIESTGAGYRLGLRPELAALREKFYGKVREARLSQAAIDVLAIVAYNQPLEKDEVERIRGAASGGVLSQLVGRQLLRIERPEKKPRKPRYHTTDRFLALFGLASLDELPQSQDFDRAGG